MAVILYRKGTTDVIRGVTCESGRFEVSSMAGALRGEWVANPNDLVSSNDEKTKEDGKEGTGKEAEGKKADEGEEITGLLAPTNDVRAAAKEAGIDGWEKKRIKTLEGELANVH